MIAEIARLVALAIFGGFVNWFIRGGGWKSAIYNNSPPFDISGEDWYCGAIFGIAFVGFSGLWWPWGIFIGLCMVAGATPRWREYIGAMLGQTETIGWGIRKMTLRMGFWGICLAVGALIPFFAGVLPQAVFFVPAVIVAGLSGGLIYYGTIVYFRKNNPNRIFNHWTLGEMIFGAVMWSCLDLLTIKNSAIADAVLNKIIPLLN